MPGLNSSLNIALSGLQATQASLNVVGHNIANINTPGYTRQMAVLTTNESQAYGGLQFGTGVTLQQITSVRNRFLDMQITQSTSKQAGADTRYSGVEAISPSFQDDGTGLGSLVQKFFGGFQTLAANPEDGSARTNLLGQANNLITGMQSRYQMLEDQRKQADNNITSLVTEVNTLATQIAALNTRITTEPTPGSDNDGRDQRQALANQLGKLVGVQVFENDKGALQITLDSGAAVLVSGGSSFAMSVAPNPVAGQYQLVQVAQGSGTPINVTSKITDGELGGNLSLRDTVIPGYQQQLDQIAAGIAGRVNLLHRTGFSLNGATTGTDFFLGVAANGANGLPTTITAATNYRGMVNSLSVNAAVLGNPNLIAASATANTAGDNTIARSIAALQGAANTVDTNGDGVGDSGPYSTSISSLVNKVGTDSQSFQATSTNQQNLLAALNVQRDRGAAVDLDEEATNLITFQRAYQSCARFVSVVDQLTDQLVNQFGR